MEVISGKEIAAEIKSQIAADVEKYSKEYGRKPNLVVVIVGDDPGSVSYVTGKPKAANEVGIDNQTICLTEDTTEEELLLFEILMMIRAWMAFLFNYHCQKVVMKIR